MLTDPEDSTLVERTPSGSSPYMRLPSPMGGLFDSDVYKDEPPGLLDFDLDLPSTLNSTRSSLDEPDNEMMANWQMNEVFQDLSSVLNDPEMPMENELDPTDLDTDLLTETFLETSDTPNLDLSALIQETIGQEAITYNPDNLSLLEALEGLEEEEALSPAQSSCPSPTIEVVQIDHPYVAPPVSIVSAVEVKPHETKKQAIRRVKNNAASKVCRRTRKNKLQDMFSQSDELLAKNVELKRKIAEVESVVSLLKEHLIKATKKGQ